MPEQSSQLLYMPPGRNDEAPTFQLPSKPRIFHFEEDVPQQCVCNLDQSTVSQVLFHLGSEEWIWFKIFKSHAVPQKGSTQSENYLNSDKNILNASLHWKYHHWSDMGRSWQERRSIQERVALINMKCHCNTDRNDRDTRGQQSWALPTVKNEAVVKTAKRNCQKTKPLLFYGKADHWHNSNIFKELLTSTESHKFETSNLISH